MEFYILLKMNCRNKPIKNILSNMIKLIRLYFVNKKPKISKLFKSPFDVFADLKNHIFLES